MRDQITWVNDKTGKVLVDNVLNLRKIADAESLIPHIPHVPHVPEFESRTEIIPYTSGSYSTIGGLRTKNPLIINADIEGLSKIDCMAMHSMEMGFPGMYGPGEDISGLLGWLVGEHPFTPEMYHVMNSTMTQTVGSIITHQFHCMMGNAACHYHEENVDHFNHEMDLGLVFTSVWNRLYPWLEHDELPGSLHAGSRYS